MKLCYIMNHLCKSTEWNISFSEDKKFFLVSLSTEPLSHLISILDLMNWLAYRESNLSKREIKFIKEVIRIGWTNGN